MNIHDLWSSSVRYEKIHTLTWGILYLFLWLWTIVGLQQGILLSFWKIPTSSLLELKGTNSVLWGYWGISANSCGERDGNKHSSTIPLINHRLLISISQIPIGRTEGEVGKMESPHWVTFTLLTATDYNNYSFFLKPGPIWHMLEGKK